MRKYTRLELVKTPLIAATAALSVSLPASADDIDVYSAVAASQTKPNIVFVLDYSGSMTEDVNNQIVANDSPDSKIAILKSAVEAVIRDNAGKVNVGVGSIYRYRPSGVKWPVSDLEADANTIDPAIPAGTKTVADIIAAQLSSINPGSSTATVNGLAEAAAYFRGDPVLHSDRDNQDPYFHEPSVWDVAQDRYVGGYDEAATPSSYSPQDAYVFDAAGAATEESYGWCTDIMEDGGNKGCEGKVTFNCDLQAEYTYSWEAQPAIPPSEGNAGSPAREAGSAVQPARQTCQFYHSDRWTTPNYVSPITQACQANFIVLISDGQPTAMHSNTTLSTVLKAAGVPAGEANKCDDLSTTTFAGTTNPVTAGNCGPELLEYLATTDINPDIEDSKVKTFTVGFSLEGPGKEYLKLLAEKGQGAFYEATQPDELNSALSDVIDSILAGSQSFSEPSIDIDPATFAHDDRTYFSMFAPSGKSAWQGNMKGYFLDQTGLLDIYGNSATISDDDGLRYAETAQSFWSSTADGEDVMVGGASESITSLAPAPNNRNLFTFLGGPGTGANFLDSGDTNITNAIGDAQAVAALDWLANAPMGDPLHTKPVSVNYGPNEKVVFVMTNQGIMHAFDASNPTAPSATPDLLGGDELFAFMPKELLTNIPKLYQPSRLEGHVYGLDGTITRWHNDLNGNGYVDKNTETIKLIFGMRRGGDSYYSLDVTDPSNPVLDWQIGGNDPRYPKLAQSWSRASLVKVNDGGATKDMLILGGGYDAAVVDNTTKPTPASGNAIYFVDPVNGNKVKELTDMNMVYSIPSDLTVIDIDQNGTVDRAYVGDLGGQMWRLDFDDISGPVSLKRIADVKASNNDHQPIFYPPSVSINRNKDKRFLAVAFGTGDRTQPMINDTQNALYMIRDTEIEVGAPDASTFSMVKASELYDASSNDIGSGNDAVKAAAETNLAAARGWKIRLAPGEKSLSKVTTYQGSIFATTFDPNPAPFIGEPDPCSVSMVSSIYKMNLVDAQPVALNADGSISIVGPGPAKRKTALKEKLFIPPSPIIAYLPKPQLMVGREVLGEVDNEIRTVFWHAK